MSEPTWRVLVTDPLDPAGIDRLQGEPGVEVDVRVGLGRELLLQRIGEYDALIVRSETRVDGDVIAAGRRLRVIGRAGVGTDNIDVEAATRRGIVVVNTPEANTVAAAEHTFALMLAAVRRIPWAHHCLAVERRWDRRAFVGIQLSGKTLGLIGIGRIGREVARRAQAFGMGVLAYDPFVPPEHLAETGVEPAGLDDLLGRSDVVSIHCPLTPKTRGLVGADQLARVRPGAFLVNCARGGIVDEQALAESLRTGRLSGAAVDVYAEEPPDATPLWGAPNLVMTPHLGASTKEAQSGAATAVAEEVMRVLKGDLPRQAVNVPSIPAERWPWAQAYVDMARRLGRLLGELLGSEAPSRLEIVYRGELAHAPEVQATSAACLWGLLSTHLQEGVTMANAREIARERGMEVIETHSRQAPPGRGDPERPQEDVPTMQLRAASSGRGDLSVGAQLGAGRTPGLCEINSHRVRVEESGYLLISSHQDRPGIIGKVGTVLGQHRINIAYMQLGRDRPGGQAVMVVGVDSPVPDTVMAQLRQVPDLLDIRLVEW